MDFSAFSTAPVISAILILAFLGSLLGYQLGSKRESDKRERALKEADAKQAEAVARLSSEHEEKVRVLNKANSNEIEKLGQAHKDDTEKLTEAHQKLVDSLKEGYLRDTEQTNLQHGNLISQLNDANLSNTREMQREYEERVTRLNQESKEATESLKKEHAGEILKVKTEAETTISELKQEQSLLQDSVAKLEEKIKEERKNNTFSMSKSGDRLMSVVRSVQELANELESTSKTVTGGEYSVFSELRDNRKQEKILSLGENEEARATEESDSFEDQPEKEEVEGQDSDKD